MTKNLTYNIKTNNVIIKYFVQKAKSNQKYICKYATFNEKISREGYPIVRYAIRYHNHVDMNCKVKRANLETKSTYAIFNQHTQYSINIHKIIKLTYMILYNLTLFSYNVLQFHICWFCFKIHAHCFAIHIYTIRVPCYIACGKIPFS